MEIENENAVPKKEEKQHPVSELELNYQLKLKLEGLAPVPVGLYPIYSLELRYANAAPETAPLLYIQDSELLFKFAEPIARSGMRGVIRLLELACTNAARRYVERQIEFTRALVPYLYASGYGATVKRYVLPNGNLLTPDDLDDNTLFRKLLPYKPPHFRNVEPPTEALCTICVGAYVQAWNKDTNQPFELT